MLKYAVENPIFIIGAPRSGTSILGRILERHPNLVHIREPRLIWKFGNDGKSDILDSIDATPRIKAHIRKKFAKFITQDSQRLLEKTPSNSLRVHFIREIFPDAKFIHILRNGYDSALSIRSFWENRTLNINYNRIESGQNVLIQRLQEMHWSQAPYYGTEFLARLGNRLGAHSNVYWGPRLPNMKKLYKEMSTLELSALQWKTCVERACKEGRTLSPNTYKEVWLKDLDWTTILSLLEFVNLQPTKSMEIYFNEKFNPEIIVKPKKIRSHDEIEIIKNIIDPTMEWLN